jgi:hypothetical protein
MGLHDYDVRKKARKNAIPMNYRGNPNKGTSEPIARGACLGKLYRDYPPKLAHTYTAICRSAAD